MEEHFSIKFHTLSQAAIYECCKGQISDGIWENSAPKGHYHLLCNAHSLVAKVGESVGPDFILPRHYGLTKCLEYGLDEMRNTIKVWSCVADSIGSTYYSLPVVGETRWGHLYTAEDIKAIEDFQVTDERIAHDLRIVNAIVNGRDVSVVEEKKTVETSTSEDVVRRITMKAINKAAASNSLKKRVEGANAVIYIVDGTHKHLDDAIRWSDRTMEEWLEILSK